MAYIVWDAPVYSNNINTLKPAMAELDSKLTTIGLIDYLSTNANNLTNFATISTVSGNTSIKLTELNYKFVTFNIINKGNLIFIKDNRIFSNHEENIA